jgi:hypothetical protein
MGINEKFEISSIHIRTEFKICELKILKQVMQGNMTAPISLQIHVDVFILRKTYLIC